MEYNWNYDDKERSVGRVFEAGEIKSTSSVLQDGSWCSPLSFATELSISLSLLLFFSLFLSTLSFSDFFSLSLFFLSERGEERN